MGTSVNTCDNTDRDFGWVSIEKFFTPTQWVIFAVFVIVGLLLRWLQLDVRPIHHDESLHMMYGLYFYDHPAHRYYKYSGMLHGPLLYNTMFLNFFSFGVSTFTARIPAAFFGSLAIGLPILFRRFFSPITVLLLTGVVALSPTLIYWSRFIRHDTFVFLGIIISLYSFTLAKKSYRGLLFLLGLSIQFCAKENAYVHLAMLIGFLVFEWGVSFLTFFFSLKEEAETSSITKIFKYVVNHYLSVLLGIFVACFLYVLLYSAYFLHPDGIWDGLYRDSIMYWWKQSSIERIKGPFMFHWYILAIYESLFVLIALFQLGHLTLKSPSWFKLVFFSALFCSSVAYIRYYNVDFAEFGTFEEFLKKNTAISRLKFLKLKSAFDIFGAFFIPFVAVIVTLLHLIRKERPLAMSGYAFYASFYTYAILGEKVPWLSLYPFITGIIYLALYFDTYFKANALKSWRNYPLSRIVGVVSVLLIVLGTTFIAGDYSNFFGEKGSIDKLLKFSGFYLVAIGAFFALIASFDLKNSEHFGRVNLLTVLAVFFFAYNFRQSYLTNFSFAGHAREMISQVHTTPEADLIANEIRIETLSQKRGYPSKIFVDGDGVWPLTWYFRGLHSYNYTAKSEKERSEFDYRFEDWKTNEDKAPKGYTKRILKLRGWWVPDYNQMNVRKFFHYAINREPWNPVGYSYINMYYKD